MMKPSLTVLLFSTQEDLSSGLQALLSTFPYIQHIDLARNQMEAVRIAGKEAPDLALLGIDAKFQQTGSMISEIRRASPATRCLVIVENVEQQVAAESAGAEAVLFQGAAPHELVASIEALLPNPGSSRRGADISNRYKLKGGF